MLKIFANPGIFLPIVFRVLTKVIPQMEQTSNYILTNEAGWSIQDLGLSSLIGNVSINLIMIFSLKKFLMTASFEMSFLVGLIATFAQTFIFFVLIFANEISFPVMFITVNFRFAVETIQYTVFLACLVGRVSKYLPKGADTLGIMMVYTIQNLSNELASLLEGVLLKQFHVTAGYYENLKYNLYFYCGFTIFLIMILPLFMTGKVRGLKEYKS